MNDDMISRYRLNAYKITRHLKFDKQTRAYVLEFWHMITAQCIIKSSSLSDHVVARFVISDTKSGVPRSNVHGFKYTNKPIARATRV